MRSGFVAVVGRTGVGKSTLTNSLVGTKVSIVSKHPNTTRAPIQGVLHRPGVQAVLVDTPGFHRPRTRLGERLNDAAGAALTGVDITVMVVDAAAPVGPGDRRVAERLRAFSPAASPGSADCAAPAEMHGEDSGIAPVSPLTESRPPVLCVVNKIDRATRSLLVQQLAAVSEWDFDEYFPVSAATGEGLDTLVEAIASRLPVGPAYYPDGVVSDTPEAGWVAELVREAFLKQVRAELPHALACRVTDWDGPYIRCEVLVERESQKAIVVGRNGRVLKQAGIIAREQLPEGTYLDLVVKVAKDWQSRDDMIDRFGYGVGPD